MPKRTRSYREGLLASLADTQEAAHYLEAALEESSELFLVALRDVAEARQMAKVAKDAGVAREALYRMLSESGNPTLSSLSSILKSLGLRLSVDVLAHSASVADEFPAGSRRQLVRTTVVGNNNVDVLGLIQTISTQHGNSTYSPFAGAGASTAATSDALPGIIGRQWSQGTSSLGTSR
jgi:probable addiction module antidote protein